MWITIPTCLILLCACTFHLAQNSGEYELSIIHMNDFHDRYEEISPTGGICRDTNCIGGISRIYSAIKQLTYICPNSIILNAGDNFQGTFWYTFYKWNVTQHFFNLLPIDVYTLGNHEFDDGVEGVLPFIKAINAPVVVTNIDSTKEPLFQMAIKKSVVLERNNRRIGVIGVISRYTKEISHTGNLKFLDEIESVNTEAKRMVAEDNVDTIIVLSHCGLKVDKLIAQNASPKIGLIVGGHSHSLLYTGTNPGPDKIYASYPITVFQPNGRKVLIVQSSAYSKYIGQISVRFNANGDVVSWIGNSIYLNASITQDDKINQEVAIWKKGVDSISDRIVGSTIDDLNFKTCRYAECTLGNFVTDAMVYQANMLIAIVASEGLRASIPKGNITYGDLALAVPFRNTYDLLQLRGAHLKELLEYAAGTQEYPNSYKTHLKSVAGLRVVYNTTKAIGSRVVSAQVFSKENSSYEDLVVETIYSLVVDSYTIDKSSGNPVLNEHMMNRIIGFTDIDILVNYLASKSPIKSAIEGRITFTI